MQDQEMRGHCEKVWNQVKAFPMFVEFFLKEIIACFGAVPV